MPRAGPCGLLTSVRKQSRPGVCRRRVPTHDRWAPRSISVTPTAPVRLHRIRNDQLYHYYLGDPLEVLLLRSDGTTDRVVVGPNLRGGEHLQLFIPGDTFHTARVIGRRRWFLGASTEWPGVVPSDVETGNVDE